jgi:superfamily I DNA and RNA helicase
MDWASWLMADSVCQNIIVVSDKLATQGHTLDQIALISFHGKEKSHLLSKDTLGKWPLRKATGAFDKNENALWTEGHLFAETVSRFKGQSAPVVVLCEVDFEELRERELRKLFVGFTRAQYKVVCLMSERAEAMLMGRV